MKNVSFIIIICFFLTSCDFSLTREMNIELPRTEKMLGLYCIFSPDSVWKTQVFKLGNITDYEYDNSQLLVNDAQVKLFCDNQFQESLVNIGNGIYISSEDNKPISGHAYYIEVSKENFPNIISDTASVMPNLQLDSIFLLDVLK